MNEIDDQGYFLNLIEYQEERIKKIQKGKDRGKKRNCRKRFLFLTDLPVTKRNVAKTVEDRKRGVIPFPSRKEGADAVNIESEKGRR